MPASEIDDSLNWLTWLLSFARGSRVGALLPVGVDANGQVTFERIASNKVDPWSSASSWLPLHSPTALEFVAPNLYSLWQDASWSEPLITAICWYMEANQQAGGIEGALIMSQAALELLYWVVMVENSPHPYRQRPGACPKIVQLLAYFHLPQDIPNELTELKMQAERENWKSGPQSTVSIRNAYVHPQKAKRGLSTNIPPMAKWQALQLNQWYLEVVILKLLGYIGTYLNRVTNRPDKIPM